MVSSRSPGVNVSPTNSVATSRVVVSDSDVARDGDAILPSTRQSYRVENEGGHVNGAPGAVEWSQSDPPSLSMSVDLHNLVNPNLQDSGHYSASPEHVDAIASSCNIKSTNNHEEEESYEAFGSVEGDADDGVESPGSSSAPSPTSTSSFKNPRSPNSTIGRHSCLRTSLRRTPPCSGRKRLSSNALASQLYRSGSFNSSGISSNCDPADDMYSDVSLEDDVIDLNHKVQMIQEQMHAFQSVGEERYVRAKQENATLQARILMLEEAAKDAETRAEERLQAEQRRHRDWASRLERERQLQLENYAIKLQAIELEETSLRDEIARLREQLEKVKVEKNRLENDLEEARREIDSARESERQAISRANEAHYQLKAVKEELTMKIEDQQKIEELMQQVAQLQACNKSLEESRDELQAAAALQAGRELLMLNPCNNSVEKGPSLAVELLAGMNQDQIDGQLSGDNGEPCNISEIKQALKEQQEVNTQLRAYIDGILLNIVENYPQLLEVKQTH
ncbi:rab11 family-interacting protein 4 isoform X1 [Apis mellifera caucasica]|uniref:Rab11 family-interacting protein 4 isoform X1 n=2 Tax=Apis mellifera TaxID=7460 RepID=A0A7M7R6T3_APIME|nr:rab11 family-interacting protein 4 isoform X1 [Apis mellifera]KAG6800549.1 rab11 family-interacting protein 4 isoform X1 [Apis mellifera caucasica]|eukprot:XP_392795.3 rab11 family-interacting protein 4 isoform X1 [Apis mellifera]